MKKIVPYKKELTFKTEVAEITSISLENTLKKASSNFITGDFIISGEYKIIPNSVNTEKFSFELPFDINIDTKYKTDDLVIDIDDFYYELNDNKMVVNISVLLDNLEESMERIKEETIEKVEDVKLEVNPPQVETKEPKFDIFNDLNVMEAYRTYKVYIVREGDTLESIMEKFKTTKEELELYNDLTNISSGLKVIIPANMDEKL